MGGTGGAADDGAAAAGRYRLASAESVKVWSSGTITASRLRLCLDSVLDATKRGEPTLICLSGPPSFCLAMATILVEEVGVPRAALCRLD